ncbi:MAG: choice-of-anchor D domain-containing protein, partial [Rubripirellula sp.]
RTIRIYNDGLEDLLLTEIPTASPGFTLISPVTGYPQKLLTDEWIDVTVRYEALTLGKANGHLTIPTNNATHPVISLDLTAETLQIWTLDDRSTVGYTTSGSFTTYPRTNSYDDTHQLSGLNKTGAKATWTFDDLEEGWYAAYATWPVAGTHSTSAKYTVSGSAESTSRVVNQNQEPSSIYGDQVPWEFLAYQYVGADRTLSVTLEDTDNRKFVAADAARLYRVHQPRLEIRSGEVQILNGMQVSFDTTQRGAPVERTLTLRNTSNQPLSIESIRELPESFELVDFAPRYLAPGESMPLQIKQTAVDVGVFTGTLALATSDPRRPIVEIDLSSEVVSRALVLDDRDERFEKSGLVISLTNPYKGWHDSTIRMVPTPRLPSEGAWVIEGLDAGTYSIGVTWQPTSQPKKNGASNIPVTVSGGGNPVTARIDQTTAPAFQAGV